MYIINGRIILKIGKINSVLYNPDRYKLLHIKNKLADMIIDGKELPKRVLDFVGCNVEIQTLDNYLSNNPIKVGVDSIYIDLTNACNLTCKGCYSYQKQQKKNISINDLNAINSIHVEGRTNLV